jgi:hypothetical protein
VLRKPESMSGNHMDWESGLARCCCIGNEADISIIAFQALEMGDTWLTAVDGIFLRETGYMR